MSFIKGQGPFQKGQGGRRKGARNKRTVEFQDELKRLKFNLPLALVQCYQSAWEDYEYYKHLFRNDQLMPTEDNSPKFLKIALDASEAIASYSIPKLKSIEYQRDLIEEPRPLRHLSNEELDQLQVKPILKKELDKA